MCDLAGDFLNARDKKNKAFLTHVLQGMKPARRQECYAVHTSRGYRDLHVYAYNERDYGGPSFNSYKHRPAAKKFRALLQEIKDAGLRPIVWLAPDDAKKLHKDSVKKLPAIWQWWIPLVDDLVYAYCVCLEMDEAWSEDEQLKMAAAVTALTERPVYVHWTGGNWGGHDFWKHASTKKLAGIFYQYRSKDTSDGKNERVPDAAFVQRTKELVQRMKQYGKEFHSGEYAVPEMLHGSKGVSEKEGRRRGALALKAGAHGFVNGG